MTANGNGVSPRIRAPSPECTTYICRFLVFLVGVIAVADGRDLIKEGCRLSVQAMPGKNTPLLLEGKGQITSRGVPWLLPTKFGKEDILSLASDEEITVACPGQKVQDIKAGFTCARWCPETCVCLRRQPIRFVGVRQWPVPCGDFNGLLHFAGGVRHGNLAQTCELGVINMSVELTSAVCPRLRSGSPVTLTAVQTPKGVDLKEDQLTCNSPARAVMKRVGGSCGRTGRWYQLGFNVTGIGWLPLFGSCVDTSTGAAIYVESEIKGRAIEAAQKEARRPSSFAKGIAELYDGYDPEAAYKKTAQQSTLTHILGSASLASEVLRVSGLVRGHLSPDGDYLWAPHQWATYFYANVAPQWETINGGHWKVVENLARKIAGQTGKDLKIYTGTHGILKMVNKDGKKVPIYLVPSLKKIPVPEHFWKVIYDPSTQAGIALVSANNPSLMRRELGSALPCTDVCALHGWPTDLRKDVKKGLIACCTVGQLRSAGFALPASVRAKKILRGPRHKSH